MAIQTTLAIVKPDATSKNVVGETLTAAEKAGLEVLAVKRVQLTRPQAERFYAVHRERAFYGALTEFMSSGPVVVIALRGAEAIATWRGLLGDTNPERADEGTLRKRFGTDIQCNGFHGSDQPQTAAEEVAFMFAGIELIGA